MTLHLAPNLTLPGSVTSQHMAVLGKTGSGKTSTAKLLIEHLTAAGSRVCILDPIKSDWWGLTSSASGKRAGLPFQILGGPHGHVPVHPAAGKAIADVVANGAVQSSIIDMAEFPPGGQAQFFVDFAPALMRKMRGVVYLVIEEAHLFAPKERSGIGSENMAIHWAKTMASAGRSKGIRLVVVTHRIQALHNAVLGSCETMIVHRLTAPADQEPVSKWLKANTAKTVAEQVSGSMSSLKTGEGWICSGEAKLFSRVHFPRISTYDNSATPTGDGAAAQIKTAPIDQDKLRALIGEAAELAKADDPKELRKTIAEQKARIAALERAKPAPAVDQGAIDRAVAAEGKRWQAALKEREQIIAGLTDRMGKAASLLTVNGEAESKVAAPAITQPTKTITINPRIITAPARNITRKSDSITTGDLPRGEGAVLRACIQYPNGLERGQLTVLTGYKRSSRDAYIQRLRERGYVEQAGERVLATAEGIDALPDAEPLPTGEALQQFWIQRLPTGERVMLEQLIAAYPESVPRDQLSEQTGYKRSSRDAYLQRLSAKELVTEPSRGEVKASGELFD